MVISGLSFTKKEKVYLDINDINTIYLQAQKHVQNELKENLKFIPILKFFYLQKKEKDTRLHIAPAFYRSAENTIYINTAALSKISKVLKPSTSEKKNGLLLILCHELIHAYQKLKTNIEIENPSIIALKEGHASYIQEKIAISLDLKELNEKGTDFFIHKLDKKYSHLTEINKRHYVTAKKFCEYIFKKGGENLGNIFLWLSYNSPPTLAEFEKADQYYQKYFSSYHNE